MMRVGAKLGVLRLLAFSIDWVVIAAWGGLLFGIVMFLSGGEPQAFSNPWLFQGVGFLAMTLPVTLYFAIFESSNSGASIGKRVVRLRVRTSEGDQLTLGRSFLRNALKFVPWEMGHLVAQQSMFSGEDGVALWVYLPMSLSFLLPLWWFVSLFQKGKAPYDSWSGASVERFNV